MRARDLLHDVLLNLTRKKMRSALTMVGVIIGALAVVTTVALGHGLSTFLDQQVRAVANPLTVEAWPKRGGSPDKVARGMFKSIGKAPQEIKEERAEEFMGAMKIKTVDNESVEAFKTIPGVAQVKPKVFIIARSIQMKGDDREFDTIVMPWVEAGPNILAAGPGFSSESAAECIVSEAYMESLGIKDPNELIGRELTIRVTEHPLFGLAGAGVDMKAFDRFRDILQLLQNPPENPELMMFTVLIMLRDLANSEEIRALSKPSGEPVPFQAKVVGIGKKGLLTNIVYVPNEFAAKMGRVLFKNPDMYTQKNWGMGMVLVAESEEAVPAIRNQVKDLGFKAHTMEDFLGKLKDIFGTLQKIMLLFAAIAFFVATFSVINTLLMAVMERKREIGVLQALGATRWHVMKLFACEAAAIGLGGGLIGLLSGGLIAMAGNVLAHHQWGHILGVADLFVIPNWLAPVLLVFTTLLGLAAGVYPAWRAAQLDPAEALRYE